MSYGQGNFGSFEPQTYAGGSNGKFKKLTNEVAASTAKLIKQTKFLSNAIDSNASFDEIRQQENLCREVCKQTQSLLTDLRKLPNADSVAGKEQQERRTVLTKLAENYSNAFKNFQQLSKAATAKQRSGTFGNETDGSFNQSFNSGEQMQSQMTDSQLQAIQDRDAEIAQLEEDMMNVNDIFRDLNQQISQQGEIMDSIEENVQEAVVNVEHANEQLEKGVEYKKKADKKKICIVIAVIIIIVIIALIIWSAVK